MKKRTKIFILVLIFGITIARAVPDSFFGSAWPVIRTEMNFKDTQLGFFNLFTGPFALITSLVCSRLSGKISSERLLAASLTFAAISLFGYTVANSFIALVAVGIPLAIGNAVFEIEVSSYLSLRYPAKFINFRQSFYGVGTILSPYIMSLALRSGNWRSAYLIISVIDLVMVTIIIITMKKWRSIPIISAEKTEEVKARPISFKEMFTMRSLRLMMVIMMLTNVIETACCSWGCTYLVEVGKLDAADAAALFSFFFVGLTAGNFASGLFANKIKTWNRVYTFIALAALGIALMIISNTWYLSLIGLVLIGFGNGPIYSNLIALTPYNFGKEIANSAIGIQVAACYVGILIAPVTLGYGKKFFGQNALPYFAGIILILMAVAVLSFVLLIKKKGMYNKDV